MCQTLYLVKVKFCHTCYRALGPELIPVPRRSVCRCLFKSSPGSRLAITFRQACSHLLSRRTSPSFNQYQVILLDDRHINVNNLHKVVTQIFTVKTLRNTLQKNKVVHKFESTLFSWKKVGDSEKNRLCCVAK